MMTNAMLYVLKMIVLSYDYHVHHHTSSFCYSSRFDHDPQARSQMTRVILYVLSYYYHVHYHTSFCSYPHFDQDPQARTQMMKVKIPMMQVKLYVGKMISFALADPQSKTYMM